MASPALPSAVPAGPAPAVPTPAGAGQPQTPNERILAAIGADGSQPAAPQQTLQQHAAAAVGGEQGDPIEALLANLPQDHPARARFQSLRTVEGRVKTLSAADQRAAEAERAAGVAAIAAVRRGADPYELAAQLGVDPSELISAAGWEPGQAQPSQAERPRSGQPASPGGEAAPRTFTQRWDDFVAARELGHPHSWAKPFNEGMTQAATLREMADAAIASAVADGSNPAEQAAAQKHAALLRQQADAAQSEAMMEPFTRMASMVHQSLKALESRIGGFEAQIEEANKAERAAAAEQGEWRAIGQAMRASREPNGVATFGPEGYGIFSVDEAGNVTGQPTPEGRKVLEMAHAVIGQKQWPRTMDSLTDALDLIASDYVLSTSEGGAQNPAGQPSGGDFTLPGQGLTPGNGAVRPSPSGQAASAPTGMF